MRYRHGVLLAFFALAMLVLVAQVHAVNPYEYGCCLTATDCVRGDPTVFTGGQAAFEAACSSAQGTVKIGQICQTSCEIGCCCAAPNVPGSQAINSTEDGLKGTAYACQQKQTLTLQYSFKHLTTAPAGTTCVQLCGGGITTPAASASTYTIKGTVRKSASPASAKITFTAPGVQKSTTTGSTGYYEQQLPANKQYLIALEPTDVICKPQTIALLLAGNVTRDFTLDCTGVAVCKNTVPIITNLTPIKGTSSANFTIAYDDACSNFNSFVPFVGPKGGILMPQSSTTEKAVTLTGLDPAVPEYCVYVRAYQNIGYVDSAQVCGLRFGNPLCTSDRQGPWCGTASTGGSAILSCDDKNALLENRCADGSVCSQTTVGPKCVPKTDCNKCNGLLGLFAKLGLRVPSGSGMLQQLLTCGSETPQCYKEQTFVPSYQDCAGVACANYTSAQSCAADTCKAGSCEWKTGNQELGTGVCTSKAPGVVPSCRQCDAAFGYCDKALCGKISPDCYYDGVDNGLVTADGKPQGCIPKQEMACRFYDTQADCGNAKFDIQYSGTARVGGTNARTASNDKFGLGACTWIAASNRCVKDADNYMMANEDDCIEAGLTGQELMDCLTDVTPPTTTLVLKTPPVYGSSEIGTLPYRVEDDKTAAQDIKTFFCINTSGRCYPNAKLSAIGAGIKNVDADYTLYYYSMDSHFNSEPVTSTVIQVRKDNVTRLNNITIEENER